MKQDKFLIGILVGIVLLIILSLGLFFIRKQNIGYLNQNTPEAIAHDYVTALQLGDYDRAYSYLIQASNMPSLARFRADFTSGSLDLSQVSAEISDATISGDTATVTLIVIRSSNRLFNEINREPASATLIRSGDTWVIKEFPFPFWGWSWYQTTTKP